MSWSLKPEKLATLKKKIYDAHGTPIKWLRKDTQDYFKDGYFPQTSARRLFSDGASSTSQKNQWVLFAYLLKLATWNRTKLSDEDKVKLDAAIGEYCNESVPPTLTEAPDSRVKQSPDVHRDYSAKKTRGIKIRKGSTSASDNYLLCKTVWAKLIHLRDKSAPNATPVYKRFINNRKVPLDVFDELIVVRTMIYAKEPKGSLDIKGGRHSDYSALQPIYPPRTIVGKRDDNRFGRKAEVGSFHIGVEYREYDPERVWQGATNVINGFQRGSEFVFAHADDDCDRITLVVDLSSLPVKRENLFLDNQLPFAHLARTISPQVNETRRMYVEESETGSFIVDTAQSGLSDDGELPWNPSEDTILKDDIITLWFPINWDAIPNG